MPRTSTWIIATALACIACSAPAPIAQPTQPTIAADAPAAVATPPDAARPAPTPRTATVARPAWSVGQALVLTRTLRVFAERREQASPPTTRSLALTGLAPLTAAAEPDRAELALLEAILAAATGPRTFDTEIPELAAALGSAFPDLTVKVRSATLSTVTADGASYFIELELAGPLAASGTRIVDTTLVGELLVGPRSLALTFYGPGSVELKAGLGGRTTPASVTFGLDAR